MAADAQSADVVQVRHERDFYRQLLELGTQTEFEPFLKDALALVVEIAGARQGYLELHRSRAKRDAAYGRPACCRCRPHDLHG